MEGVLNVLKYVWDNKDSLIAAANGLLASMIVISLLIPGPHPEDWLQSASDFLKKFSRK